jgi:hypothetical protein
MVDDRNLNWCLSLSIVYDSMDLSAFMAEIEQLSSSSQIARKKTACMRSRPRAGGKTTTQTPTTRNTQVILALAAHLSAFQPFD